MSRIKIHAAIMLIALAATVLSLSACSKNGEEKVDELSGFELRTDDQTTVCTDNVKGRSSGETPPDVEEENEPYMDNGYVRRPMEFLMSEGYPVYDKNVTGCSAATSPRLGEYVGLATSDGKDKVVEFYVEAGGTPEYYEDGREIHRPMDLPDGEKYYAEEEEEGVVLFRYWNMPVGIRTSQGGEGTEVIYDYRGEVFLGGTE